MNRLFRILASCVLATVVAFGSLVGGAFAQTTPDPANFTLKALQSQIVKFNPAYFGFSARYTNPTAQPAEIVVSGGGCVDVTNVISAGTVGFNVPYPCGSLVFGTFENKGPGSVDVQVVQK
ncbi:MAG TPA: hypothetical protein VK203_18975 [Nostocaceae cyanobacterium]|nr:hypothetical protein [Nostocaceae cyanobacterium]